MPENAENLLRVTKPSTSLNLQTHEQNTEEFSSENESNTIAASKSHCNSYTTSKNDNMEFKQRLERILASPLMKPNEPHTKPVIHGAPTQKPVPLPRKRVMFNNSERTETQLYHAQSQSETDETPSFDHHQK